MSRYQLLRVTLPPSAEELLVGELWTAGTLGLETRSKSSGELEILAYFEDPEGARSCVSRVAELGAAAELELTGCGDRDWLAQYRRRARPFLLGSRLEIDPGEPREERDRPLAPGRDRLRLPARRAFGTGEHESTRLVIETLEGLELDGRRVLDLGCGSGILSFAAVLWGAKSVTALELDPVAAWTARANQLLNRIAFPIVAGRVSCLRRFARFDLAVVNVLPHHVRGDLADLRAVLESGARVIFSGILEEHEQQVRRDLAVEGFRTRARRGLNEWVALETRTGAPAAGAGGRC